MTTGWTSTWKLEEQTTEKIIATSGPMQLPTSQILTGWTKNKMEDRGNRHQPRRRNNLRGCRGLNMDNTSRMMDKGQDGRRETDVSQGGERIRGDAVDSVWTTSHKSRIQGTFILSTT